MGAQFRNPGNRIAFTTIAGDFVATVGASQTLLDIRLDRRATRASAALATWLDEGILMRQKMSRVRIIKRTQQARPVSTVRPPP